MKHVLILFLITTSIFAQSIFFNNIEIIENKFYNIQAEIDPNDITKTIDEKYYLFDKSLEVLKNKPYDLKLQNNFKYNEINKKTIILQEKIKINQSYKYNLAVVRDEIELNNITLKNTIHTYFSTLANNWTTFDDKDLDKLNNKNIVYLNTIQFHKFNNIYNQVKSIDGKVENKIKENFEEFNKHYKFFNEFIVYINNNKNSLSYKSLTTFLHLGVLIDTINSNTYFKELNTNLRFISTDMGRIILFLTIIILFVFLNFLVYKKIYEYFKDMILEDNDDEVDDILLENLNKLRKPISFLVISIGLKLSSEILVYPTVLSNSMVNIFYFTYILLVIYILFILIDNFLLIYLTKRNDKNETLRREIFALSSSIVKIIIAIVGILLFLVKIEVNISAILASLGIGGLAVAFAAQTTLSNFFGLIKMLSDKSFSQGDWIETNDVEGFVVEIGFISTQIRTFDNALITIPNATLANSSIKNWSLRQIGRRIKMNIAVTYSSTKSNLQNAINEIDQMLKNHLDISIPEDINYKDINENYKKEQKFINIDDKYGVKSTVLVYLDQISDSSLDILIYAYSKTTNWDKWLEVKQDVIFKVWEILEKNDLEFAFPSRTIYMENKSQ